ncbi:MAG: stress response translation initiation inhibitor YciH [Anaerolineae bacterium]
MPERGRLVYSSASGRIPKEPTHGADNPPADKLPKAAAGPQTVYIQRSSKGRAGKQVTLISGVRLAPAQLEELGALLRKRCGTGGTIKDGVIELQGDQREGARAILQELGYRVKLSGG